nr:LamG domain-containing protein [bacterium]
MKQSYLRSLQNRSVSSTAGPAVFLLLMLLNLPQVSPAATGDSLLVQTFTFDSIATRRATFHFPTGDRRWEKIQMFYTLKCDDATPGDSNPCGEWDVTTHTFVRLHTGRYDSTLLTHPSFEVAAESPQQLVYSNSPRYHYYSYWEDPGFNRGQVVPTPWDHYLLLEGEDFITVPAVAAAALDSALTISCWVKGDSESQPQNDQLLEMGEAGGRIVNLHLPWGTGTVYFDAGGRLSGNNNRLEKAASPGDYKGRWNHWAFTKDVRSGMMMIYLNGKLWHSAGNMTKTMPPIEQFIIGANCNANGGFFAGAVDQIRLWDVALDGETIKGWMYRTLTPEHPHYKHLRLCYDFEGASGGKVHDSSPHHHHGVTTGQPQRLPFGLRGRGDLKPEPGAVIQVDSVLAPRQTVRLYQDPLRPDSLTGQRDLWPAYDSWFDGDGRLLFTEPAEDCDTLFQEIYSWYGPPFEIIEKYELARFITPYGLRLDLGVDGFTWIYEVTDYAPLLAGEVDLQAANDFELLDLRFLFIEGVPPHDLITLQNLWPGGSYRYGDLADDLKLTSLQLQLPDGAVDYRVRSRIS